MTDLEITKACAEAMGFTDILTAGEKCFYTTPFPPEWAKEICPTGKGGVLFDPLHDDAQAMALAKKFQLLIELDPNKDGHHVRKAGTEIIARLKGNFHEALNRAICECVAKMSKV